MSDLGEDLILQRLEWIVRAIAQPHNVQSSLFPSFVGAGEELVLEFDQWFREIRPSLLLSQDALDFFRRIDEQSEMMSKRNDDNLWFDDYTLATSVEWEQLRTLARRLLDVMGWSHEPPPSQRDTYVR